MLLENKCALVVGVGDPLGQAIARALAAAGADVVLADTGREPALDALLADIRSAGRRAVVLTGDVADGGEMARIVEQALAEFSHVDVLVNNVRAYSGGPFVDMPRAVWDSLLRANLRSVFVACRAVLPQMLERHSGAIVNVVSQAVLKGTAGAVGYSTSLGGVIALSKALALEVGRQGVRVNVIAPASLEPDLPTENALGRAVTPEEMAPGVVFLASEQASLFFGQVLCPNGGDFMI